MQRPYSLEIRMQIVMLQGALLLDYFHRIIYCFVDKKGNVLYIQDFTENGESISIKFCRHCAAILLYFKQNKRKRFAAEFCWKKCI